MKKKQGNRQGGKSARPLVAVVHDRLHLAFLFGAIAAEKHRDRFIHKEDMLLRDRVWYQGPICIEAHMAPSHPLASTAR